MAMDTIQDGKFELHGVTASPQYCNLIISSNTSSSDMSKMVNIYMFLDNSELTVNAAHLDSLQFVHPLISETAIPKARVEGGPLQREFYEYRDTLTPLLLTASEVNNALAMLNMQNDQYTTEEYNNRFDELYPKKLTTEAAIDAAKMEFIRQHPQSPVSLFIAEGLLNTTFIRTAEEIKELTRIAEQIEDTVRRPRVLKMAEIAKTLYKGASYKDIELTDPTGKTVKLSQYILPDHYTLVDFWASWCGPCMGEVPHLKKTYDEFRKKGFEIYGVSFDEDRGDWLGAVEQNDMNWLHVSEVKGFDNQAAKDYAIQGIPSNFLIDGQGTIVAKNLRGEALYEKISELLAQ